MMYISKGASTVHSGSKKVTVKLRGNSYELSDEIARAWQAGQNEPVALANSSSAIDHLIRLGIAASTEEDGGLGRYRLLTDCIIIPAKDRHFRKPLELIEQRTWTWISKAGIRLSVAELINLAQKHVRPAPELLGEANRQRLVEAIYTTETIGDSILENLMEHSEFRDNIVDTVYDLLKKHRIVLI